MTPLKSGSMIYSVSRQLKKLKALKEDALIPINVIFTMSIEIPFSRITHQARSS